jgi:hypothetical protein
MTLSTLRAVSFSALMLLAPAALAQQQTQSQPDNTIGAGTDPQNLPPPRSDSDPLPPVPSPGVPETGVVRQAGVGGEISYARAGVVELGGSAAFSAGGGATLLTLNPQVGWFVADNLQLSGILRLAAGGGGFRASVLAEPSYHIPFTQQAFGFLGVGFGIGANNGVGFALSPRLGANFLVGRSGIFTPALFFEYNATGVDSVGNSTTATIQSAFGINLGFTVML